MAEVVIRTTEEVFDELDGYAAEPDGLPTVTNRRAGGRARGLLWIVARGFGRFYEVVQVALAQAFPDTAEDTHLDSHAVGMATARKPARKTRGNVRFTKVNAAGNELVAAGRLVGTELGEDGVARRFAVVSDVVIPDGTLDALVLVEAEEAGTKWNVGDGIITELVSSFPAIDSVVNEAGWITVEGLDEEQDYPLQQRLSTRFAVLAAGAVPELYRQWALEDQDVGDAVVDDLAPRGKGTVDVWLLDRELSPADAALVAAVQASIDPRKPNVADVVVAAPAEVFVDVSVHITVKAGYDPESVRQDVDYVIESRFRALQDETVRRLRPGDEVDPGDLEALARGVEGVRKAKTVAPAAAVPMAPGELPRVGTRTILVVASL